MRPSDWSLPATALAASAAVFLACAEPPSIDGSRVPSVANPTCPQACDRLVQLCGYAPLACVEECEASDDAARRSCIGQAPSCQATLESCAPEETDGGDGGEDTDAESEGAEEDDGGGDAGSDAADHASDAATD